VATLQPLTSLDLSSLRPYGSAQASIVGVAAMVARTGYTGEDGFELFVAWDEGPLLWDALLEADTPAAVGNPGVAGAPARLVPCGLGARDTLRLEAGMPLYGNELDRQTNPYEAGLGRFVHLERDTAGGAADFAARDALLAASAGPLRRQLVGLVLRGRGIARHGYPVRRAGEAAPVGQVTSGSQSPTRGDAIAMAYVPPSEATPGTMLEVVIRDAAVPAEVVALPFYRRAR
jgi:aminomethyltransferase